MAADASPQSGDGGAESVATQPETTGGVVARKRPGIDSSDAICSGLSDIMLLIGKSHTLPQ